MSEQTTNTASAAGDAPPKRKRGRPPGVKMRIAAEQLRHHHFSFVREVLELPHQPLRNPWERYLAFEGGPDDERHFSSRLRELVRLMRFAANERGLGERADVALAGVGSSPPSPAPSSQPSPHPQTSSPALPSLDDWIAQRCDELGIEADFQSQAEWLAEYQEAFGLNQPSVPMPAIALPSPVEAPKRAPQLPKLAEQLAALNKLAHELAKPPALADPLRAWLSEDLALRLAQAELDGRRIPIVSLDNLITFVNLHHHRWWVHVPRLGRERGDRLTAWLAPLAEALGRPLKEIARRPLHEMRLARERSVRGQKRYGMVPLDELAVPPELSGRDGIFRASQVNVWDVHTDLDAIFSWMRRHATSPRTSAAYGQIVERFYLWSVLVKRKAMSSLNEGDLTDYRDFITRPPADWVQERQVVRGSSEWRPFRGPLSAPSRKRNFIVISSMLNKMREAGYLSANAAQGVLDGIKTPGSAINIDRSFTEAQWAFIMRRWAEEYALYGPAFGDGEQQPFCPDPDHKDQSFARAAALRRTRLLLELGATTGLRLSEFPTTRLLSIKREVVNGEEVSLMKVLGKGNKLREVLLFDDVLEMMEQHHRDMDLAGTSFDPSNKRGLRALHVIDPISSEQIDVQSDDVPPSLPNLQEAKDDAPDWSLRPLVGALRKAPMRWKLGKNGVKELDPLGAPNADPYGSMDPSALYQSLKRFFAACAREARTAGMPEGDAKALAAASTHWMRHFFANSALADGVAAEAVKDAMGHASLTTTSIYLRTERKRMVEQIGKLRRRHS